MLLSASFQEVELSGWIFVTLCCESNFLSEAENVSIENRNKEQKRPEKDVGKDPDRAVEWSSKWKPQLRGGVEVLMVEAEKENYTK